MIADDWPEGVTRREYWEQITAYAGLAIKTAQNDLSKLSDLIDRVNDLPPPNVISFLPISVQTPSRIAAASG